MNFTRNWFGNLLWLIFAVMSGAAVWCLSAWTVSVLGCPGWYGDAAVLAVLLMAGLLSFGLHKLMGKIPFDKWKPVWFGVTEGLLVILLLAGGICLRVLYASGFSGEYDTTLYEVVKITPQGSIPQVVHGATYFYLQLLHLVLLFVGNKINAVIILQLVLQVVAFCALYFAVRRFAGPIAAIVSFGFLMLSQTMITESIVLSPRYMLLLAFSIVLCIVGGLVAKAEPEDNPGMYLLAGILIGVVVYLDLFGLLLLVFAASVLRKRKDAEEMTFVSRLIRFLLFFPGTILGYLSLMAVDAFLSHKNLFNVLSAWAELVMPGGFCLPVSVSGAGVTPDVYVLVACLAIGIFGYWYTKRECFSTWILSMTLFVISLCFGMMSYNMGSDNYILIFLAVLAGISLDAVLHTDVLSADGEYAVAEETDTISGEGADTDGVEIDADVEILSPARKPEPEAVTQNMPEQGVSEQSAPAQVQFIENPLPLPKKHRTRVLDYAITDIGAVSDYDYPVAEDDDFDI